MNSALFAVQNYNAQVLLMGHKPNGNVIKKITNKTLTDSG